MEEGDEARGKRNDWVALSMLAGAALLLAASVISGPLAIACGAIGGTLLGYSAITPFLPRDDTDMPLPAWSSESDNEASAEASSVGVSVDSQRTGDHWTQRATAKVHVATRGR